MENEMHNKQWKKPELTIISSVETTETVLFGSIQGADGQDEPFRQVCGEG